MDDDRERDWAVAQWLAVELVRILERLGNDPGVAGAASLLQGIRRVEAAELAISSPNQEAVCPTA